jgi:hypothetical protein
MDIKLGDNAFVDVQIPLLWGSRAISQDRNGRLSVIDLSGGAIKVEIIGDEPVPGVPIAQKRNGFDVLFEGKPLYHYDPEEKTLIGIELDLPDCQVGQQFVRVGENTFGNNTVMGSGIGIVVTATATWLGGPLPAQLQPLVA